MGASIDAQLSSNGATLLHLAVTANRPDLVALLLAHGADIRVRNESGHTPLHDAAIIQQASVIIPMLGHPGFDAELPDSSGRTVSEWGEHSPLPHNQAVSALLSNHVLQRQAMLLHQHLTPYLAQVEQLVSQNAQETQDHHILLDIDGAHITDSERTTEWRPVFVLRVQGPCGPQIAGFLGKVMSHLGAGRVIVEPNQSSRAVKASGAAQWNVCFEPVDLNFERLTGATLEYALEDVLRQARQLQERSR